MFRKLKYYMVFICLINISCSNSREIWKLPDDFNFIARYGIAEENSINTFDNTFTKKINWDRDTTISLTFPLEEKKKVYNKIMNYAIKELSDNYKPKSTTDISPSPTYYLLFKMNGTIYEITWETNTFSEEKEAKKLRALFTHIDNYLKEQEVIANLPDDERGVF